MTITLQVETRLTTTHSHLISNTIWLQVLGVKQAKQLSDTQKSPNKTMETSVQGMKWDVSI